MASLSPLTVPLGKRLAKHLLKRATFNVSKARIDEFSNYTVDQAISALGIFPSKNLEQPIHYVSGDLTSPSPWINDDPIYGSVNIENGSGNSKLRYYVIGWWLDEARRDTSYRSKMSYFLHTDFTVSSETNKAVFGSYYDYLKLLEFFSLGDWKEFVFQMIRNSIMLAFLDNRLNTVKNPNENFAREVLELFTIGKGAQTGVGDYTNYTEDDVVETAKVMTGWKNTGINSRKDYTTGAEFGDIPCGYPLPNDHDFGEKKFSHRFNNHTIPAWEISGKTDAQKKERMEAELKEFINLVLNQEETAKFICRKMYRFFVSRNITSEIENDIIVPLATVFRTNYNLGATINILLKSKHFYDADDSNNKDEIIGGLIKSPLDLALQTLSVTNYPVPDPITMGAQHYKNFYYWQIILAILDPSGQNPFSPSSVAGFPPNYESPDYDKFWFNSSTIISRYNMASILLNPNKTKVAFYVTAFIEENVTNPKDATVLVTELIELLFPEDVDVSRLNYFLNDILLEEGEITLQMWSDEWTTYTNTGNRIGVEVALVPLFKALLWSQEYQNN